MKICFLGGCDLDEFYSLQSLYPSMGGKGFISPSYVSAGGMVANASIVARSLQIDSYVVHELSNYETSTSLIISDLEKFGVNTSGISTGARPNKRCLLITENSERVIFVVNEDVKKIKLTEKQLDLLLDCDYIYTTISDLQFFEDIETVFLDFKGKGKGVFIDCDANITKEELMYLQYANIMSVNEFGYEKLQNIGYDAYKLINDYSIDKLLLTLGKEGAKIFSSSREIFFPAVDVKVLDTTGAGDTFNICYLYAILCGAPDEKAIQFSSYASSQAISQIGPRIVLNTEDLLGYIK